MHIDNKYEKLVESGYIEAGTLVIDVDDITKLQIGSEEVVSQVSKQKTREDKGVVIVDRQGRVKKVSSLMFGYNKHHVQLKDGSFANGEDLLVAMQEAISRLDQGSIVIDKKGKILEPEKLLRVVEEAAGKVTIGQRSTKIKNQDSRYWSVQGIKSDVEHKKGVVFLGNDGITLDSGEYVSLDELLEALNNYKVMVLPEHPEVVLPEQPEVVLPEQPEVVRVTHKYKNKLSRWLALLAIILVLLSGFKYKKHTETVEVPVEYEEQIMKLIEKEQLRYRVNGLDYEPKYEDIQESAKRIVSELKMGDTVELRDGDVLYENSALGGSKVNIGQGRKQAGDYQISGVSIIYNGNIFAWHVDPSIENPGFEIGNFINETCSKYGLDYDQVEVRLHIGNNVDYTRLGWIEISKLVKEDQMDRQVVGQTAVIASTYDGTIENFSGSTITVDTINGPVVIKVIDSNGNFLASGTTVIGSDGKEYMIDTLSESTVQVEDFQTVTKTVMEPKDVSVRKLTWRIQDCSLTVGIAPLLGAIAAAVAIKKKNEEMEQEVSFFEFENEEEYKKFKREFEEAKEKYEKTSGFKRMIKDVFYRKEVDLLQRLTKEQVQQLYAAIRNWHDSDYSYNPSDQIEFRDGKIIVKFSDGKFQDITDIVMPAVYAIGSENQIEAEGLLKIEEEQKDGIHKR